MCGFLAVFDAQPFAPKEIEEFRAKSLFLQHRGNSSKGEYLLKDAAFFHHRLAFRDLKDGAQPLHSPSKKQTIVFNGELYDFHALRTELAKNYSFQTRADTEVILAAYLADEKNFLHSFDGEYAYVIHDTEKNSILAARDPFGVKPLFFAAKGFSALPKNFFREYREKYEFTLQGRVHFSSEVKGIPLKLSWDRHGLNRQLVGLYEEVGTAFENVIQLPPGALLRIKKKNQEWHCTLERIIPKDRLHSLREKNYSFETAAKSLRMLIEKNVKNKLDSDVPLGAYLSGGVDSRIVAYEMSKQQGEISTFTVGFEGSDFDESQEVQNFLQAFPNLKGHLLRTTNDSLHYSYEHAVFASELVQPYTNGCAKWWLSRFARRYVRGVLTGDGADEIFCGYPSYRYLAWWQFYSRAPSAARAQLYATRVGNKAGKAWENGLSSLENGTDLLQSEKIWGFMHPLFSQHQAMSSFFKDPTWLASLKSELNSYYSRSSESKLTQWQNYFLHTHFPTHVLNWVGDRMEMANTLEGRPIYLSRPILDLVRTLPDAALVRGMRDKAILRKAYAHELQNFSRVPKKQFNAPFLQTKSLQEKYVSRAQVEKAGIVSWEQWQNSVKAAQEEPAPLQRSFAQMFVQNIIVAHILQETLLQGHAPERNLSFEENFLDEHSSFMGKR